MKKLLAIALLMIPFFGFSQTTKPVDGFLGIKFGSSKEEVIAAIKAKGGTLDPQGKDPDFISFSNFKLGDRATEYIYAMFIDNKAYLGGLVFKSDLEAQTINYYNNLVNDVNSAYGPGKSSKEFTESYTEGDGYEVQGISLGKVFYHTNWFSGDNKINIFISPKLMICMNYFDGKLYKLAEDRKKEKTKSSF